MSCFLPPHILKMLYFSLFYSQLIYSINVWGGCGITNSNKITNIQQRALSFFTNKVAGNDPLPYNSVYQYFSLCKFQRIYFHSHSQYFFDRISELLPCHQHCTRFISEDKINVPYCNKSISQNHFFYNAVKHWNSIPPTLKIFMPPKSFKCELLNYLSSIT